MKVAVSVQGVDQNGVYNDFNVEYECDGMQMDEYLTYLRPKKGEKDPPMTAVRMVLKMVGATVVRTFKGGDVDTRKATA